MAKFGLFPAPVARRIYLNAGGGGLTEIREFTPPRGGGRSDAGRFILTSTPTGGSTGPTGAPRTATANIVQADSPATTIESGVTLYLNFDMYSDLTSGDYGDAVKDARGKWMAVNAPCSS
jgi:hypothetical protein